VDVAVHLGDLINATHPDFQVAKKWGLRIIAEFKAQANLEAQLGLPVAPSMASLETTEDIASAQIGFVDYVVAPLVTAAADLLPELADLQTNLHHNRHHWSNLLHLNDDEGLKPKTFDQGATTTATEAPGPGTASSAEEETQQGKNIVGAPPLGNRRPPSEDEERETNLSPRPPQPPPV